MTTLYELYKKRVVPAMQKSQGYSSVMQVPVIKKITLNMGLGAAMTDKKRVSSAMSELALIGGQQPVLTCAKKSVAGFKIRQGFPIGCKVTLRRAQMWGFLQRLIAIAMPRIRDFRGLSPHAFDGCGNYSLGIKENLIFPEIDYDKVEHLNGLDVCITTSAANNAEAKVLLEALGFPFRK